MAFASILDLSGLSFDTCDRTASPGKRITTSAQDTLSSFSQEMHGIKLTVEAACLSLGKATRVLCIQINLH